MFFNILFILLVLALLGFSVRARVRQRAVRERSWDGSSAVASPLSEAILGLIGTAGGLYLSVELLFSFLEISVPGRVELMFVAVEPVAAACIALAIAQPLFANVLKLKR